jgi:glycine cleavage system H lipoate-binding protein
MDPFPTKGVEYLLVLGYLAVFVPFVWLLSRIGGQPAPEQRVVGPSSRPRLATWFGLPDAFLLHRGHTWAVPEGNGIFKVGMDDFAHRLIGEPTSFQLPKPGTRLAQGEIGWQVAVNGSRIDLLSPVNGRVIAVNSSAVQSPTSAMEDPYGAGWLMRVKVPSARATLRNLLPSRLARAWIEESREQLNALVGGELGPVLQDGGVPVNGFARAVAGDDWPEIATQLLLTGPLTASVSGNEPADS